LPRFAVQTALGASPLVLVLAFGELLDDLGAECWQVVGVAARDESLVDDDLLVYPVAARVADVSLEGRIRGQRPAADYVRFYELPRTVADRADRLGLLEEGTHEVHGFVTGTQVVCPYGATGHDQAVVLIGGDLRERLLHRERLTRVDVAVHGLGASCLKAYDVYRGAFVLYGLLRLLELGLLGAYRSQKDGYLLAL